MAKTQRYGIKFPIKVESPYKTLVDLNTNKADRIKSDLMHLIFTPKGQMLRKPNFGTNLIQFIFNPNDSQTWDDVKYEIKEVVSQYIEDCTLVDIEIAEANEGMTLLAKMIFNVNEDDGSVTTHELLTNL